MKKKIIFISDNTSYRGGSTRYIGPYRIADELEKNGYQTYVLDYFYILKNSYGPILEKLIDENLVAVGIATTFFSPPDYFNNVTSVQARDDRVGNYYDSGIISLNLDETKEWFASLKKMMLSKSPRSKLYVGGAKASLFTGRGIYSNIAEVDFVVIGGVDQVFHRIIDDQVKTGRPSLLSETRIVDTLKTYLQEKSCPPHQWRSHWLIQKHESLPIEIGRGCAFNCKFCHYEKKNNSRKGLAELKNEFTLNYENYGTQYYQFTDDCFNDNRKKVEEICNMILSLPFKIEWVGYSRFDVAVKFPDTVSLMIESGARGIYWGVESLTYEVARRAGKGTHPDAIKEFMVRLYKNYGHYVYFTGSFISGLPGETRESWYAQVDWMIKNPCFHFINVGPLGITKYQTELDGKTIDYADYSRNPEKYGFDQVSFDPYYWRHKTMDLNEAKEHSNYFVKKWLEINNESLGLIYDIWCYPNFRSLGFSGEEIKKFYFSTDINIQKELTEKIISSRTARYTKYIKSFNQLI